MREECELATWCLIVVLEFTDNLIDVAGLACLLWLWLITRTKIGLVALSGCGHDSIVCLPFFLLLSELVVNLLSSMELYLDLLGRRSLNSI